MIWLAWIEDHETPFNPATHCREDLTVLSLRIAENVGIAPIFEVEMSNPGAAGLLVQSRRYAVISEQLPTDVAPVELARGVVMSAPTDLAATTVRLEFRCQPPLADTILRDAANDLRIGEVAYDPSGPAKDREDLECYDPLFVGQDGAMDPSTALEGRYEEWIWDRRTLGIGRTHIFTGFRTVDVASSALEGSVLMSLLDPPSKTMRIRVIADWTQAAKGVQTYPVGITQQIVSTYTFEDFVGHFPAPGTPIGADTGWTLAEASLVSQGPSALKFEVAAEVEGKYPEGTNLVFQAQRYEMKMRAAYDYQQAREEVLDITMPLSVHDVIRDDRIETVDVIELNNLTIDVYTKQWEYENPDTLVRRHYVVGDEVQANGYTWTCVLEHDATVRFVAAVQSGSTVTRLWERAFRRSAVNDIRTPIYFDTNRGIRSIMHACRRLARRAMMRARCLELSFECSWSVARDLTLDDSIRLEYRYLPGGEAIGKLTAIELSATEGGTRIARLTVSVAPGLGTAVPEPEVGQKATADGQVVYSLQAPEPVIPVNAYALPAMSPLLYMTVMNAAAQETAMGSIFVKDPETALQGVPTQVLLAYPSLREEDLLPRKLTATCEPLPIPQGINLHPED